MSDTDTCLNCEHLWADHGDDVCGQPARNPDCPYACGCTWADTDRPTSVSLTDEEREQLLRTMATAAAELRKFVEAVLPVFQAAAAQAAQLFAALQKAGLLDEHGQLTKPTRPAWQSPYGPPQKGHRS